MFSFSFVTIYALSIFPKNVLGEPNLTSQYSALLLKGAGNSWSAKEVLDNAVGSVESDFCSSAIKSWLRMSLLRPLASEMFRP